MPPSPVSARRGLPPGVLALLYLVLVLLPIGLAALHAGGRPEALIRAGRAAGMAAAAMVLLQMVSSGRFEALSGRVGIDVTMGFHKWAMPVAALLAVLHPLLLVGPTDPTHPGRIDHRFAAMLTAPGLTDARIGLLLLLLLIGLALVRDRLPLRYELWRMSHALTAVAVIGLILWHILTDTHRPTGSLRTLYWPVLAAGVIAPALWVYVRRLRAGPGTDWIVSRCRKLADRLWEVTLAGPEGQRLAFQAGQFAWLAFGRHRLPLYDHPFSIASAPTEGPGLRFIIQEAGDFTNRIGSLQPGTRVGIDAPHGSFMFDADDAEAVLLIAGGVGIAPILSILTDLAARDGAPQVRLIYAARDDAATVPPALWRGALDRLGGRVLLLTDAPSSDPAVQLGPLTGAHLREALTGLDPARCHALICGPGPMMTAAADQLHKLGLPLSQIDYERFSYSVQSLSARDWRFLRGFVALGLAISAAIVGYAAG